MPHARTRLLATAISIAVALAGCSKSSPDNQSAMDNAASQVADGSIPPAPANDPDAQASQLMAAAEPFENLTEEAFTSDSSKLDDLIAKAKSSAVGAEKLLPAAESKSLLAHVNAIDAARVSNNRTDLAIAAVEGYRTLVSSAPDNPKVPKQVSLLDYSGFRYQANLKATPPRWSDTLAALDFADGQWKEISSTVSDQTLSKKVSDALSAMRSASQKKDAKAAMAASTTELDLVDLLEKYFAQT